MNIDQLTAKVRHELARRGDTVDMADVAETVAATLTDDELRPAVNVLMRRFVGDVARIDRQHAGMVDPQTPARPMTQGKPRRTIIAEAWAKKLDSLVSIDGSGQMKRLGACTADEISTIADGYAARSEAMREQERWYRRIAEAMVAAGASTVRGLPDETLRPLVDKVAA